MDPVNVPAEFEVRIFTRSWDNRGCFKTLGSPWIRRSRSSRVIDFGTNRKRKGSVGFLLVSHSNLGPVLHRFRDISDFLVLLSDPNPYSTLILGVFPLHQIAHVGVSPRIGVKLFGREIIFRRIPTCVITVPKRHGQTDGRTDRRTDNILWHNRALRSIAR